MNSDHPRRRRAHILRRAVGRLLGLHAPSRPQRARRRLHRRPDRGRRPSSLYALASASRPPAQALLHPVPELMAMRVSASRFASRACRGLHGAAFFTASGCSLAGIGSSARTIASSTSGVYLVVVGGVLLLSLPSLSRRACAMDPRPCPPRRRALCRPRALPDARASPAAHALRPGRCSPMARTCLIFVAGRMRRDAPPLIPRRGSTPRRRCGQRRCPRRWC